MTGDVSFNRCYNSSQLAPNYGYYCNVQRIMIKEQLSIGCDYIPSAKSSALAENICNNCSAAITKPKGKEKPSILKEKDSTWAEMLTATI